MSRIARYLNTSKKLSSGDIVNIFNQIVKDYMLGKLSKYDFDKTIKELYYHTKNIDWYSKFDDNLKSYISQKSNTSDVSDKYLPELKRYFIKKLKSESSLATHS